MLMFLDQVAGEAQQEEVQGPESTPVQMAGPVPQCKMTLPASSRTINPTGICIKMLTQLRWQGLLQMREQGVQEWQQQWQECGPGDRREEQEQVDKVDQLAQVKEGGGIQEEIRGMLEGQPNQQPMRLRVVPSRSPVTAR